jgi:DNA-binding NarL/FixJ family response regulator
VEQRGAGVRVAASGTPPPDGLTEREVEVLCLLAASNTHRGIAALLVVSEHTVGNHISSIYAKIGARGRADATAYALRHGLALPDPPPAWTVLTT